MVWCAARRFASLTRGYAWFGHFEAARPHTVIYIGCSSHLHLRFAVLFEE